jgi:hypothetical protein
MMGLRTAMHAFQTPVALLYSHLVFLHYPTAMEKEERTDQNRKGKGKAKGQKAKSKKEKVQKAKSKRAKSKKQNAKKKAKKKEKRKISALGIEPRESDSKSEMLPLHHADRIACKQDVTKIVSWMTSL